MEEENRKPEPKESLPSQKKHEPEQQQQQRRRGAAPVAKEVETVFVYFKEMDPHLLRVVRSKTPHPLPWVARKPHGQGGARVIARYATAKEAALVADKSLRDNPQPKVRFNFPIDGSNEPRSFLMLSSSVDIDAVRKFWE